MKKVGFFITKGIWGGASRYVFDIVSSLDKKEFDSFVVCGIKGELSEKLRSIGIRVYEIESMQRDIHLGKELFSLFKMYQILRKEQPDVLHLNSPKASGLGSVIGRFLSIKRIVYTIHGLSSNEDRSSLQKTLIKFFTWLTILFATDTVVLSKTEYNQIADWPFVKKKIHIISLGIEDHGYLQKIEARKLLSSYIGSHLTEKDIVIGTIAELHKNKGLVYAINALSETPNYKYVIIGDGEEKEVLTQIINNENSHIFLTGQIKDAAQLIKGFDIFLLPSIKEGLPYVLLEAGLAQVPIVATDVGGIKELISETDGLVIASKNPKQIITAINQTLKNPLESKVFCDNLKNKIQQHFNKSTALSQIVSLYKKD